MARVFTQYYAYWLCAFAVWLVSTPGHVLGHITVAVNTATTSTTVPTMGYFQYKAPSVNFTGALFNPTITGECQMASVPPLPAQDFRRSAESTMVVPGNDIWDNGCHSYAQVLDLIMREELMIRKAGFPTIRGVLLVSPLEKDAMGAAGGPDDTYCAGAQRSRNVTLNKKWRVKHAAAASLAAADGRCRRPALYNSDGREVSVSLLTHDDWVQLDMWLFGWQQRNLGDRVRMHFVYEAGRWNSVFDSLAYFDIQWIVVILGLFMCVCNLYTLLQMYRQHQLFTVPALVLVFDMLTLLTSKTVNQLPLVNKTREQVLLVSYAFMTLESALLIITWLVLLPFAQIAYQRITRVGAWIVGLFGILMFAWAAAFPASLIRLGVYAMMLRSVMAGLLVILLVGQAMHLFQKRATIRRGDPLPHRFDYMAVLAATMALYWILYTLHSWLHVFLSTDPYPLLAVTISADVLDLLVHLCVYLVAGAMRERSGFYAVSRSGRSNGSIAKTAPIQFSRRANQTLDLSYIFNGQPNHPPPPPRLPNLDEDYLSNQSIAYFYAGSKL